MQLHVPRSGEHTVQRRGSIAPMPRPLQLTVGQQRRTSVKRTRGGIQRLDDQDEPCESPSRRPVVPHELFGGPAAAGREIVPWFISPALAGPVVERTAEPLSALLVCITSEDSCRSTLQLSQRQKRRSTVESRFSKTQ